MNVNRMQKKSFDEMELLRLFETFFCSFIDIIIRAGGSKKKDSEEYKKLCVKRKKKVSTKDVNFP